MITKVEKGYVNDDFLEDRITLKAHLEDGSFYPCKLYGNGNMVTFSGVLDDYEERPIELELEAEIRKFL